MTLISYLKEYKSTLGTLTALFVAIPFVGKLANIKYIAPPVELHVFFLYVVFFICIVFATYFLKDLKIWKKPLGTPLIMGILLLISLSAFFSYDYWFERSIRSIYIPSLQETDYVIVGTEKSEYAKKEYPNYTDEEMLKEEGYKKGDIKIIWTPESVTRSRLFLIGSYFIMFLSLAGIFSIGVLKSFLDKQPR